jgi:hypothetical protein
MGVALNINLNAINPIDIKKKLRFKYEQFWKGELKTISREGGKLDLYSKINEYFKTENYLTCN